MSLIAYLVNEELADARSIAVAASHEFGVPLLDLDAVDIDLDVVRAVDQKLVIKHRVIPLVKRGQRLFLGIADPTNLQAIDDIKFQTTLRIDPVVVEQDKLEEQIVKAIEAVDTSMSGMDDDDFDLRLDLDAVDIDLDVVRAVDQKLVIKHRVIPLVKRGQRLFLGIADPTNLQAIDDIKFQTTLRIDPVVVEQDKLEEQIVKAIEAVDKRSCR